MVGTLLLGSGVGYVSGAENNSGQCTESAEVCRKFSNFWDVWNVAEARFVDPEAIKPEEMIDGAINGMLNSLGDQGHTRYLDAKQAQRFREELSGSFEGIGAYIDTQGELPTIVAPIEGSPAEKAGIRPGDVIIQINGKPTEGLTIDEVVSQVKGPKGTQVKLLVRHVDEELPVEISITRASITVPIVTWHMLPNDIAFVRLSQFAENADSEVRKAVEAAKAQGARGLIFDVRDNPGGIRDQAVSVSGLFVKPGEVVLIEANRDGSKKEYRNPQKEAFLDLPMVVLSNSGSASSAEIFAGSLQDYRRATVIGVPTAGTGTVLSQVTLDDGSNLLLGTSQWQTPKGSYLRREGVKPDITVGLDITKRPLTPTQARRLSETELLEYPDPQVQRAMAVLGAGPTAAAGR
jgi:carboxyl-terminal processing protease